jgi:hypothetical protein
LVLVNMLASLQIFQVRAYAFIGGEIIYIYIYILYIIPIDHSILKKM